MFDVKQEILKSFQQDFSSFFFSDSLWLYDVWVTFYLTLATHQTSVTQAEWLQRAVDRRRQSGESQKRNCWVGGHQYWDIKVLGLDRLTCFQSAGNVPRIYLLFMCFVCFGRHLDMYFPNLVLQLSNCHLVLLLFWKLVWFMDEGEDFKAFFLVHLFHLYFKVIGCKTISPYIRNISL